MRRYGSTLVLALPDHEAAISRIWPVKLHVRIKNKVIE